MRDVQTTQPPAPLDEARLRSSRQRVSPKRVTNMFGVPTATCDRATPFSTRSISVYDVGNSMRGLKRWECNTVLSLPANSTGLIALQYTHATNSSNALILSILETSASTPPNSAINTPKAMQDLNLTYKVGETEPPESDPSLPTPSAPPPGAVGAWHRRYRSPFSKPRPKLGALIRRISCLAVVKSACDTEPAPSLSVRVIVVHVELPANIFLNWDAAERHGNDAAWRRGNGTKHRRSGTVRKRHGTR